MSKDQEMKSDYYLATTGISEIWDLEAKLLVLGPWCLTDEKNEKLLSGKDYISVPSPWRPASKIKEAAEYCFNIYKELLEELSEDLNRIHNLSLPLKSWRILLSPWLLHFVEVGYDRYKRIENTHKLFPNFYTCALTAERCNLSSLDTDDFFKNKINDDFYNLMLFSVVLNELYPENTLKKDLSINFQCRPYNYSWKRKLFHKTITFFDIFLKNPVVLSEMYHLSPKDMFLLKCKAGFNAVSFLDFSPKCQPLKNKGAGIIDIRKKITLRKKSDQFQDFISRIIPNAMPVCYLENFDFYRSFILRLRPRKLIGSSIGWYFNERFKFFAAEAASSGAKLIDFQHGGGYGTTLSIPLERFSLSNDIFYTWGWALKNVNTAKPLPSAHLSKLNNSYNYKLDNLLVVSTSMPRYVYILHTYLLPEDVDKYFNDKTLFLKALSETIKGKILYRPYDEFDWGETDIVREASPSVKFIYKDKLYNWMKKAKLVVIDHPHTSYLEALCINVPSIFYWDHDVFLMRNESEEYFQLLRDAGILYKSPEDAAKKVNEIFDNPVQWWLREDVQNARLKFCERYAYAKKDWIKIWAREFKNLRCPVINN